MSDVAQILVGVDVGGTHTDVCLAADGALFRGKSFTTHDDYSRGTLDAIGVAAERTGRTLREALADASSIVVGTTVVTNAITELKGAKVGVLVTRGFRDTFRFAGGARRAAYDDHVQKNPPDIVSRSCIEEIDERISAAGESVVPLDEAGVRAAVRRLVDQGVDAIAVCYLWSFKNPAHELRTRELIEKEWPGGFTSISNEVYPVIREHERFFSTVFNCFCQPAVATLITTLTDQLSANGFEGHLSLFSGAGGVVTTGLARRLPIVLLASGPAGGVTGATHLAESLGYSNIMVGDMGGTSFDTSLIEDRQPIITSRIELDGLATGISIIDILSIGAGGGSIGSVDARGVPQVGPRSAGSAPGPACYGRGGTEVTVTDAAVTAGMIDVDNYLGGRVQLDLDAAKRAVESLGGQLEWESEQVVEAILELTITNMANALRAVSIERGHDPREFAMFAYGGTLPLFAAEICGRLEMDRLLIPANSSVFSAFGVLVADFVRRYSRSVNFQMDAVTPVDEINAHREDLRRIAVAEAEEGGVSADQLELAWGVELQFMGQAWQIEVELPDRLFTTDDAKRLAASFPELYEASYGPGTAWEGAPVLVVSLTLTSTASRQTPPIPRVALNGSDPSVALKGERNTLLLTKRSRETIPVYDGQIFAPGLKATGPAIIDEHDTTIFVPVGWTCLKDEFSNYLLEAVTA